MARFPRLWFAVAMIPASPALAQRTGFFPPEVENDVWVDVRRFGEPSFYAPTSTAKYHSRYRLTIAGVSCLTVSLRIDERPEGRFNGRVAYRSQCGSRIDVPESRYFRVQPKQIVALRGLIADAGMWKHFPEYWVTKEEDICLDGEQLVFERRDAAGYRISLANAQCTASAKLLAVAEEFLQIAAAEDTRKLLH